MTEDLREKIRFLAERTGFLLLEFQELVPGFASINIGHTPAVVGDLIGLVLNAS